MPVRLRVRQRARRLHRAQQAALGAVALDGERLARGVRRAATAAATRRLVVRRDGGGDAHSAAIARTGCSSSGKTLAGLSSQCGSKAVLMRALLVELGAR